MALTGVDILRSILSESIPSGGMDTDTMFTADQIDALLLDRTMNEASAAGWAEKAGQYAELVDTSEGNSARKMSDLHRAALAMAEYYNGKAAEDAIAAGGSGGHVTIGKISRTAQYR